MRSIIDNTYLCALCGKHNAGNVLKGINIHVRRIAKDTFSVERLSEYFINTLKPYQRENTVEIYKPERYLIEDAIKYNQDHLGMGVEYDYSDSLEDNKYRFGYKCPYCKKWSRYLVPIFLSVKKHMQSGKHPREVKLECPSCNYIFNGKIQSTHSQSPGTYTNPRQG